MSVSTLEANTMGRPVVVALLFKGHSTLHTSMLFQDKVFESIFNIKKSPESYMRRFIPVL